MENEVNVLYNCVKVNLICVYIKIKLFYRSTTMSVRLQFRDTENKLDQEMAMKVFEWCKNQYDWFVGAESESAADEGEFYCSDGEINIVYNNGIFESRHPIESEDSDWLYEIYEEFKPYGMNAVTCQCAYKFGTYDMAYAYMAFKVKENNGDRKLVCIEDCGVDFGPGCTCYTSDSPGGGWLKTQDMPFADILIRIKNKKTGETKEIGGIEYVEGDNGPELFTRNDVKLVDSDGDSTEEWECVKGFEDKTEVMEYFDIKEDEHDDWEFDGFIAYNIFSDTGCVDL